MPLGRAPAPSRWWWSKSPVAGSARKPTSTRTSHAAIRSRSRVRTISSGSPSSDSAARAKTSSAWNDPSWVATRIGPMVGLGSMTAPAGIWITEVAPSGGGPRLAVKDLFDTAGVRTTYGSRVFADQVPERTATAVERLVGSGYQMVGKANLHEFAWGITSENPHYGTVPNPVAPGRVAGGSSGGNAAALALGLADAALGTDSGGSVRIPAACCGVVGFKPTWGLVPDDGCFPLAPSFDHVGPMARDVAGCVRMMEALVPGFEIPAVAAEDLRVGVAWTERADPLVRERVEAAVARFGQRRAVELPFPDGVYPVFSGEVVEVHAER